MTLTIEVNSSSSPVIATSLQVLVDALTVVIEARLVMFVLSEPKDVVVPKFCIEGLLAGEELVV